MISLLRFPHHEHSSNLTDKGTLPRLLVQLKYYAVVVFAFIFAFGPICMLLIFGWLCGLVRSVVAIFMRRQFGEPVRFLRGMDALCAQESETNRTMINGLMFLEGEPDLQKMRDCFSEQFVYVRTSDGDLRYPHLTSYLHKMWGFYTWRIAKDFQIEDHVVLLDQVLQNDNELKDFLAGITNRPLVKGRPGWEVVLVKMAPGQFQDFGPEPHFCCLMRFHHSLADGTTIVRIISAHLVDEPEKLAQVQFIPSPDRWRLLHDAWNVARLLLLTPKSIIRQVMTNDVNFMTEKPLSGKKKVTYLRPINITTIKRIKNAMGTTCNDVLMGCLAGALRRFFESHGSNAPELTALLPVSTQRPTDPIVLANQFAFVAFELSSSQPTPVQRLLGAKQSMNRMKTSPDMWYNYFGFNYLVNKIPNPISQAYFDTICFTCIVSNVPGPQIPVTVLRGHMCKRVMFFLPHRGKLGLGVSFFSYNGYVQIGMNADESVISTQEEIERLQNFYQQELDELEESIQHLRKTR